MDKNLFIVSVGTSAVSLTAKYKGGRLQILQCESFPLHNKDKAAQLQLKMAKLARNGYTVAVDEGVPYFGQGYLRTALVGDDQNGRLRLATAMEAYQNLNTRKNLRYSGVVNIGKINDDIIDNEPDEQGGIRYRVAWDDLKQEQAALLVAVYNAVTDLHDRNFLSSMFSKMNQNRQNRQNRPLRARR